MRPNLSAYSQQVGVEMLVRGKCLFGGKNVQNYVQYYLVSNFKFKSYHREKNANVLLKFSAKNNGKDKKKLVQKYIN